MPKQALINAFYNMSAKPRSGSSILFNFVQNCSTSFVGSEFAAAKVVNYFGLSKKNRFLGDFLFWKRHFAPTVYSLEKWAILIKRTFWWLGVLRSFLGSSLVSPWSFIRGE